MFKPYRYQKENTGIINKISNFSIPEIEVEIDLELDNFRPSLMVVKGFLSTILVFSGMLILVTKVLVPIVVIHANSEEYAPVISPIPDESSVNLSPTEENFKFEELSSIYMKSIDYKEQDGIVYSEVKGNKSEDKTPPDYFYISIPKLKIENAKIKTNTTNLDPKTSLGHYNGSCLPDEACNTFIFGHSSYSYSSNHYQDGDYTTIFSKLNELEYGDEFTITYDGEVYDYVVDLTKVQKPESVDPLDEPLPKSLGKYENTVELFTCTPPGTTKYRLSVVGKQVL